jgi:hypothetical protein
MMATTTINSMRVTALRCGNGLVVEIGFWMDGGWNRPDHIKMGVECKKKPGSVFLPSRASILKSGVQG